VAGPRERDGTQSTPRKNCISAQSVVPVRLNMIEPNNGQALSITQDRRPRYTGERLLRERPKIYRQVVRLLGEGWSANKICKWCHVTRETVRAVERREAVGNVAELDATPVAQKLRNRAETKEKVRQWSNIIGLRAAARKFGVNEDTACWWAHKDKWNLSKALDIDRSEIKAFKAGQSNSRAINDEILRDQSDKTALYMSSAALKASFEAANMSGEELLDKNVAIALQAHNRTADTTHGWTQSRQQVQTQVAVQVVMPTPEEQEQRKADHQKLDEIARLLRERQALKDSQPGKPFPP
jgi:hypothetical protein